MAVQFDPIAKDESLNTTEVTPRNVADVLAQELANIATAIGGGGGSGGHTIENSSGTALPQRTNLQFGSGLGVTDDAVNDATVVELTGESVHANMFVKLWENPNPFASFVAQNITLASDDYDFLLWVFGTFSTNPKSSVICQKGSGSVILEGSSPNSNYGVVSVRRTATYVSDTEYSVDGGTIGRPSGTMYSSDDSVCKPVAIYGFKKSLDITAIVSNVSTDATRCIMSDGVTNVEDAVEEKARKTDIATVESGSTASRAYSVGELVYVNGTLYKVITAISLGSAFTVGTNIQSTTVSGVLGEDRVSEPADGIKNYAQIFNALYTKIDFSKITSDTMFIIDGPTKIYYRIFTNDGSELSFIQASPSATTITTDRIILSSSSKWYRAQITTSTPIYTDRSTTVPSNVTTYIIEY